MSRSEISEAVRVYHGLLEDDALAQETQEVLREEQRTHKLTFGERPVSVAMRPRLIDRPQWDEAAAASEAIVEALIALEDALLHDADLRAELDLTPLEERLALVGCGYRHSSASSRLDGFHADELRYVEYNAETPAGMGYGDMLHEVFDQLPVMLRLRERYHLTAMPVRHLQLQAMLDAFREWGGSETPLVAIVDWLDLPTVREFEIFQEFFISQGIETVICDPQGLEFDGTALWACGKKINLVYRRVLTTELMGTEDAVDSHALTDAYLAGAVCVVNGFRSKLLHKKMSLALLSDDRYAALYTPAQRDAIARHIPWTRKVREGPTRRYDTEIDDLASYVCERKDELVLKPNDEYGGKGVVLGWTVDQHEWEQAVQVAMTQSSVVQAAIPIPREPYPIALEGIEYLDLAVDCDPYLYHGKVGGCLTRLSSSALLNVTAGAGSVVPTYVVEGVA